MSDNIISIHSKKESSILIGEIKTAIIDAGGSFNGSNEKGAFSGKTILGQIKGEYSVAEQNITIRIIKKPYLVPMSKITTEIQSFFQA